MKNVIPSIALLLAFAASPAGAAQLTDGSYYCSIGSMHLGNIRIADGSYSGPAHDGNYQGSYPIEVTDAGTINWGGPLGGMSSGGNTVVSTVLKDAGGGTVGFDVLIQLENGNFQTVSCYPT